MGWVERTTERTGNDKSLMSFEGSRWGPTGVWLTPLCTHVFSRFNSLMEAREMNANRSSS